MIKLPSGAELEITLAPFAAGKALYQSVLEELRHLKIEATQDIDVNLLKDLLCVGLSSTKIEKALYECMKRATYNGIRLTNPEEIFEKEDARDDYFVVCFEVVKANLLPFTKSLSQKYSQILESLKSSLELKSETK